MVFDWYKYNVKAGTVFSPLAVLFKKEMARKFLCKVNIVQVDMLSARVPKRAWEGKDGGTYGFQLNLGVNQVLTTLHWQDFWAWEEA